MKKIIAIITIIAALAACSDELTLEPAASLFSTKPEILDETAIFRLAVANVTDSAQTITFPVTFGGTAERNVDYTASADAFVFGGENPVDSIVITTLQLGTDRTLSLTVSLPDNFEGGKYLTSEYTLQDKIAYFTFQKSYTMLTDSLDISFSALDRNGKSKAVNKEAEVRYMINAEKSTAIEGEDFIFADSSRFVISNGKTSGKLRIKSLNPHPQNGKDKIVLNLAYGQKFGDGNITEMEISLTDTLWKYLDGEWKIDTLVTDSLYMDRYWKDICTGLDLLPAFNARDEFAFGFEACTFDPGFRSSFKNFFIDESSVRKGNTIDLDLGNGESATVQTFMLDNTNRYFSAEEESEDKESLIGFSFIDGNTDSLNLYVLDYTSKTFMPELLSGGKYAPEKPAAASPGLFLNATFNRQ